MENKSQYKKPEAEEQNRTIKEKSSKIDYSKKYSEECRKIYDEIIADEIFLSVIFIHFNLKERMLDPNNGYELIDYARDESTLIMAQELDVIKANQDISCPKCYTLVKCLGLSKHLAVCMNPQLSSYSYSSRNSSRIARQRIQEGFKTSFDESKHDDIDDEQVKPKKRCTKPKKSKYKNEK